jgi:signal transduction histidine kinase
LTQGGLQARFPVVGAATEPEKLRVLLHELRTPLAVLRLLAEGLPETERRIHDETLNHLEALVKERWNHVTGTAPVGKVGEVVASAIRMVSLVNPERRLELKGDSSRLVERHPVEEILVNLVNNSIRHSPAETPVTVHIEERAEETVICVEDHGAGVPAEQREKVFQYGYSTGASTGIGLSVSRSLAERIGGRLEIPEGATGCKVVLTIPVH